MICSTMKGKYSLVIANESILFIEKMKVLITMLTKK